MAAEILNLVKRNKIYYFRCRIPSNFTNGRAREVKISLKTGNLFNGILYLQQGNILKRLFRFISI